MKKRGERPIKGLLFFFAFLALIILSLIFIFLVREALPIFWVVSPFDFLAGVEWAPASFTDPSYGILPLISGTLLVVLTATLIAVPIGIACAIYLAEVADSRLKELLKPLLEILAGIPSVVYGFIALVFLSGIVHNVFNTTYRLNALNGGLILALMILPTIITISEDAIDSVPRDYREASLAMGATKWETIRRITLPASKSGITVGVMLGLGRAVGETMAVMMATGNSPVITFDILRSIQTMTATIAIEMGEVVLGSPHYHALFAVGLILFLITFAINLVADVAVNRLGVKRR
ncbi:phosphate ABC transporter permease subunit PstC [Candidatus Bathyarchaeota archaeon]|nr:phosphate ABC transporter permease subunit PstC [Candidatus Bathyarchaeota archaeon]MBS7630801.1 phosphate ABC transporter permease subunit PstC [Candidatus Bathyarchaeota archaeon]